MRAFDGRDAVAVIGLSCRLPGAVSPTELRKLLRGGDDAISQTPDAMYVTPADGFDGAFFGLSPREAAVMDPQQRLALELCWEAMEDAGIVPGTLAGGRAGVFVGAISEQGMIANRVSSSLGLRGASLTVDPGQSSSACRRASGVSEPLFRRVVGGACRRRAAEHRLSAGIW